MSRLQAAPSAGRLVAAATFLYLMPEKDKSCCDHDKQIVHEGLCPSEHFWNVFSFASSNTLRVASFHTTSGKRAVRFSITRIDWGEIHEGQLAYLCDDSFL